MRDKDEQIRDDLSDIALLRYIANQKISALEIFYKRHIQSVYAFVVRRMGDAMLADEVANDTLHQVWHSANSFQEQSSVKTWLLGIAKNKSIDAMRKRGRIDAYEVEASDLEQATWEDESPDAYTQLLCKQNMNHLNHCFSELPQTQQTCIHLSFVEGLTLAQIAEILTIPAKTVATRIHHAKRKLRECIECLVGKGGA